MNRILLSLASLVAISGGAQAASGREYSCRLSVYTPEQSRVENFSFEVPGNLAFTFEGTTVKLYGNTDGTLNVRLGQESTTFPYAYSLGTDFPKSVGSSLATAGGTAAALHCDRKD